LKLRDRSNRKIEENLYWRCSYFALGRYHWWGNIKGQELRSACDTYGKELHTGIGGKTWSK